MLQLLAEDRGVNAEFLGNLARQFIANDAAGNAVNVGKQEFHRVDFALCAAHRELGAGALDEVVEIALRAFERLAVGIGALTADEQIGIESGFEGDSPKVELFLEQQAKRALCGPGSRGVRIEVHNHVLREPSKQAGLQLGKGGAGTGDDVVEVGGKDRNAV